MSLRVVILDEKDERVSRRKILEELDSISESVLKELEERFNLEETIKKKLESGGDVEEVILEVWDEVYSDVDEIVYSWADSYSTWISDCWGISYLLEEEVDPEYISLCGDGAYSLSKFMCCVANLTVTHYIEEKVLEHITERIEKLQNNNEEGG